MAKKLTNNKHMMYSFEKIGLVIALVITLLIVALVLFATMGGGGSSSKRPSGGNDSSVVSNDSGDEASTPPVVMPEREIEFTTVTVENSKLSSGALILVNQDNKYGANIENDLVNLYSYNQTVDGTEEDWYGLVNVSQKLRKDVVDALNAMYKDYYTALEKTDVVITKTYVSAEAQQKDYDSKIENADPADKAYMQAGGYSEHQTGLAFNLRNDDNNWFVDNCWKYGFIQRYPDGKESVTKVKDEDNHYRYVGVPHALYIKLNKLAFEEYLGLLETKTYNSRLKLDDGTSDKYETYAVKAEKGAETQIKVPAESSGWGYTVSGTNNDYFVVTIYKINE